MSLIGEISRNAASTISSLLQGLGFEKIDFD
jgi:hypothetical protein